MFIRLLMLFGLYSVPFFYGVALGQNVSAIEMCNSNSIKSVQFFRAGWEFSMPVVELGSEQQLLLKFDDLSANAKDYNYSVIHCDKDWNPSRLIASEYLEGFPENNIRDYAFSINTTSAYVNYQLAIPNEDVRLLLSGNYLLKVWEGDQRNQPLLVKRFYVVEPLVQIRGEVKKATYDGFRGPNQEVDFVIDHPNFAIRDPRNDIKVVLMQNSDFGNQISNLKPLYIRPGQLDYDFNRENVFAGGNEFRNFDLKDLRVNGRGVRQIEYYGGDYRITLETDSPNNSRLYMTEGDLNGQFLVKNNLVGDSDLESDYAFVKFSLSAPNVPTDTEIYVYGALTNWQCADMNRMRYNPETAQFELTLLLKQGFYDYRYLVQNRETGAAEGTPLEGSFVETENDYRIFVYFSDFSSRYDRLVGYRSINSLNNR